MKIPTVRAALSVALAVMTTHSLSAQDGDVNLLDVNPFVELIASGKFQCEGDINEDCSINLLDVDPFITLLSGG